MPIKIKPRLKIILSTLLGLLLTLVYFGSGFIILNLMQDYESFRNTTFIYLTYIFTIPLLYIAELPTILAIPFLITTFILFFLLAYRVLKKYAE